MSSSTLSARYDSLPRVLEPLLLRPVSHVSVGQDLAAMCVSVHLDRAVLVHSVGQLALRLVVLVVQNGL